MDANRIPLADVIQNLRTELLQAVDAGEGQDLTFAVEGLELELQVGVTKEVGATVGAEGTIKFWVFNALGKAEVSGSYEASQLQTLRLKLRPKMADGSDPDLGY